MRRCSKREDIAKLIKIKITKSVYIYILTKIYNIVTAKNMHNIFNIIYLKSRNKNKKSFGYK